MQYESLMNALSESEHTVAALQRMQTHTLEVGDRDLVC